MTPCLQDAFFQMLLSCLEIIFHIFLKFVHFLEVSLKNDQII